MESLPHSLNNRELDALGQQWDAFKKSAAHSEMHHGRQGMGVQERAERIEILVRNLAALAPPRAQHVALDPKQSPVVELLEQIRSARDAVLPRRRQHDPKFRYAINTESGAAIAFLREFAGQWGGADKAYLSEHFKHLRHAAKFAAQTVALFDFADAVEKDYSRPVIQQAIEMKQRSVLTDRLQAASGAMLGNWPAILPADEKAAAYLPADDMQRYNEAITSVHFTLTRLPSKLFPDRADPTDNLQKSINELRYEACAAAHRAFNQISLAYRADRKAISSDPSLQDARDPIRQGLPMLDRVYHARWALLADAIGKVVKTNRKTLERYGTLPVQSRAEAVREQREDYAPVQGQLF